MFAVTVTIVIPLENSSREILIHRTRDTIRLPAGELKTGERIFDAARRIAAEQVGVPVHPQRLLYVSEDGSDQLGFSILCELQSEAAADPKPDIVFANIATFDGQFEPAILREVLTEDSSSGFYRPTAHLVVRSAGQPEATDIDITW